MPPPSWSGVCRPRVEEKAVRARTTSTSFDVWLRAMTEAIPPHEENESVLPIIPEGPHLTAKQAKILDDEFFLSDPHSYFTSRIAALLSDASSPPPETVAEFRGKLGLPEDAAVFTFDERSRGIQVAIDAVALRHHAAEGLIRFIYGQVAAQPARGDAPCTWLAVADSPMKMVDVIAKIGEAVTADEGLFAKLFAPAGVTMDLPLQLAGQTAAAWVTHAIELVTNNELAVNAANNKVKHGLAVSARDDVRIELITAPVEDLSAIPVSAFGEGKSVPIFDRPMLTILSRAKGAKHLGLELTSLRVDVPTVLAETWMMSVAYAALFHVAARNHFDGNETATFAPYPTLPVGPTPDQVLGGQVGGYRGVVTTPSDGITPPRSDGIFIHHQFVPMRPDFENVTSGVIVDG
jgi:hypothetical protein